MPVASQTIEVGAVQADGRVSIVERYLFDDGSEIMFCSLDSAKVDLKQVATNRIAQINADAAAAAAIPPDVFGDKLAFAKAAYDVGDLATASQALTDAKALTASKAA